MSSADRIFGGRYRIVGEVGRGGMGVIFRGVDSVLDREVAIKVMSGDFAETTEDQRSRFFREAKAAARLQHRNIVTVFEFAEQDGVPYIVMEFLKGRSLSSRLAAQPPLTLEQKLDIMSELCNGLQFAHDNGVIHRDVKPANVWLLEDGAVKLVDFGIAKISSSMTMHGADVMGSASYMSPEQIEGQTVTGRSDVFSAAVMLYEIIARRRPFEGDSPTATMMQIVHKAPPPIESIVPDLPRELISALARGLEKNPDHRYQSAEEFGSDLQLIRLTLTKDDPTVLHVPINVPSPAPDVTHGSLEFRAEPLPSRTVTVSDQTRPTRRPLAAWMPVAAAVLVVALGTAVWMKPGWFGLTSGGGKGAEQVVVKGVENDKNVPPSPPPPPPAPPELLNVASTPPGARIFVGGVPTGQTTPAAVKAKVGDRIRLVLPGREPYEAVLSAANFQGSGPTYDLKEAEGPRVTVEFNGSYAFEVYDGSKRVSEASTTHTVPGKAGQVFTLKAAKYFLDRQVRVEVRNGRVQPIAAPELGDIVLRGNESCEVWINKQRADYLGIQFTLAAGDYQLTFKCPSGLAISPAQLKINAGDNPSRSFR